MTPKCEETIKWPKGDPCPHDAKIEIEGKKLCMKHAQIEAVKILYGMGKIKKLPSFNQYVIKYI